MISEKNQVDSQPKDIIKQIEDSKSFFKITIDYLDETKVREIVKLLDDYHKNKDWRNRIYPSYIKVEKRFGNELKKCGRDECMNLVLSGVSFCSEYCLHNYVSLDEDEMK